MSGHSKWSSIKHKKAASDAKRGKVFSKIAKEIMTAARAGGGDPEGNFNLRSLIQKARSVNMPADNIDRAVKKGTGELDSEVLEEIFYEGFAPGGIAVIVAVLTDNRNRSAAEVRHVFTKFNGNLSAQGSVRRTFQRRGQIIVSSEGVEEDALLELVLESGGDDMEQNGDCFEILTDPSSFEAVVNAIDKQGFSIVNSEVTLLPEEFMTVDDRSQASSMLKFLDALEDLEDVQNVYSNLHVDDELLITIQES